MKVRAITLSRDHLDYLKESLPSVGVNEDWLYGTLVDNGEGNDGSVEYAASLGWDVIRAQPGISFAAGNNLAAAADPEADFYLLVNDDAVLGLGVLRAMLAHAHWDVTGVLIVDPRTGLVNHAGTGFGPDSMPGHVGRDEPVDRWLTKCEEMWSVTFAVALIKGETWRALGGLDEGYYYGYEDTDFCLRVWESGGTVGCCRMAKAQHGEFGTRGREHDGPNGIRFLMTWMQGRVQQVQRKPTPR